jgi:hypothetical protein
MMLTLRLKEVLFFGDDAGVSSWLGLSSVMSPAEWRLILGADV